MDGRPKKAFIEEKCNEDAKKKAWNIRWITGHRKGRMPRSDVKRAKWPSHEGRLTKRCARAIPGQALFMPSGR
ncbi:MAG: hypothetical protein DRH20_12620 [Deltaproteobacteria bacterium]|nr:MAG: hypothetical protein DRH20_12620 [Deltaproteobacteria bacterium]